MLQVQRVARGGSRNIAVVRRPQKSRDSRKFAFPGSNVEKRTNQKSDHVVEKSVGGDGEGETSFTIAPGRVADCAAVIILFGGGTSHRERAKGVCPDDSSCRGVEQSAIQRAVPGQLPSSSER